EADFARCLERAADPLSRYVVLTNRGALRVRQRRWDDALADLRAAVKLRGGDYQAHVNLARAYEGRREWDEAAAALDQALARGRGPAGAGALRRGGAGAGPLPRGPRGTHA